MLDKIIQNIKNFFNGNLLETIKETFSSIELEGMDQDLERKRLKNFGIMAGITMFAGLYIGLHLGNSMWRAMDPEGVIDYGDVITYFSKSILNPFRIFPFKFRGLFVCLLLAFFGVLYEFVMYTRRINTMDGREHGSASFNNNYKKLLHDYVLSPKFLIAKAVEEEDITDPQEVKKRKKEMEKSGKYEIDKDFQNKTGRKVCKKGVKDFSTEDIEYCKLQSQIYAQDVYLSMDTSMTQLNLNTIVFGGSGAGKSRFFVKPNLLQANSSYVVTDPSGELMMSCGKFLEDQGYTIKCLNLENMNRSNRYNPFAYVKEDSDIPIMVNALTQNIEGPKKGGGDNKFWDETSATLLIAICGYLFETQPMEKRNFNNVLKLLSLADVSDERQVDKDPLDELFEDLELANPESYAVSQYKVIKQAGTGKTAQNIIISTTAIFARFFQLDKIANLTYKDEIHLEEIGQKKCALFIVTPQGDTTYNFLASMLYTQLFATLYHQGEENAIKHNSTSVVLDVPVRCLIDEAANIGVIPNFSERLATMRKYGISACPIYQNQAQVKELFKDNWETIVGNCDTMLFLGGIDSSTVKMVSERLGEGTIKTTSSNLQMGRKGGESLGSNSAARKLMTTTEIEQMDNTQCITFIRSMKPFKDHKYPYQDHPNYQYTGDADEDNNYVNRFVLEDDKNLMRTLAVLKKSDPGYIPPARKDGVTDEDIERVKNAKVMKDNGLRIGASIPLDEYMASYGSMMKLSDPESADFEIYEDPNDFDEVLSKNLADTEMGRQIAELIRSSCLHRRSE